LKIKEELADQKGITDSYRNIGLIHYNQGNYPLALEYYEKCLEIERELGDKKGMATTWNNIALVYSKQGNYQQALDTNAKSLAIETELGDKIGIAMTWNNIASIYSYQGDYYLATDYYFKSLQLKEELGDKIGVVSTYINIGDSYLDQQDYQQAEKYFKKSLSISRDLGDKSSIAAAYQKMGDIYFNKKEYRQASAHYSRALSTREELGDKHGIAESSAAIGRIYLEQKNYRQALVYFFNSLKMNENIGYPPGIADSCQAIGTCYADVGKTGAAVKYLTRALSIAKEVNTPHILREASRELSKVYAQENQFKQAFRYYVMFKETSDSLRNDEHVKKITQLEKDHEFVEKQRVLELEQKQKDMVKEAELKRQRILKYAFSAGFLFMSLLVLVTYGSFRIKKRANRLLAEQKQEIKDQRDKLHELNVTKDKFFSIIAHDLKNPFSALIGFSKIMVTEFENFEKEQIKDFLASVHQTSQNTYNLLENLLEWAKTQTGKIQWNPEKVELSSVAGSEIDFLKRNAHNKNIRLQNEIDQKIQVLADKNMLHTVFRNLISNAIKFTPLGGQVVVHSQQVNGFIETRVRDTGIGIAKTDIEKLFRIDVHFSTNGTHNEKGTGLGLILCKEFIEKNGGKIWAESKEGNGSIFAFTLPSKALQDGEGVESPSPQAF
jgi:signal transduction histidine kinase